jgi:hypothetical protein
VELPCRALANGTAADSTSSRAASCMVTPWLCMPPLPQPSLLENEGKEFRSL